MSFFERRKSNRKQERGPEDLIENQPIFTKDKLN